MFILKGHKEPVQRVEFSADGRTLLSVDAQRGVRLWDLETRETRWALEGDYFASVTFTPDGRHVLTCFPRNETIDGQRMPKFDRPHLVLLHDVETGTASPASIRFDPETGLRDLTFSPDGSRCVAQGSYAVSSESSWWEYPSGHPLPTWDVQPRNRGDSARWPSAPTVARSRG